MKRHPQKIALARETLRRLDGHRHPGGPGGPAGPGGPPATYPNTDLPNNCQTASCHGIC
jgi:hypothetical protein